MKRLFFVSLCVCALFACKKDNGSDTPSSINGFWKGSWSFTGSEHQYEMAVLLRSDNTARILYGYSDGDTTDAAYISEDIFSYGDGIIEFQSRENSYTYAYLGEVHGNHMSGTWGELPSNDDGGSWTLTKQ